MVHFQIEIVNFPAFKPLRKFQEFKVNLYFYGKKQKYQQRSFRWIYEQTFLKKLKIITQNLRKSIKIWCLVDILDVFSGKIRWGGWVVETYESLDNWACPKTKVWKSSWSARKRNHLSWRTKGPGKDKWNRFYHRKVEDRKMDKKWNKWNFEGQKKHLEGI